MPFKMRLLAKMQAFKDEDGLPRIRTKLADSCEKEDLKFPTILPANDVVLIGHDNIRRIDWSLGVNLGVYPGNDGAPRVARIRTSHGERIHLFQRLYPLEVSAKTEIGVLKTSEKSGLPVWKTPDSPVDHISDLPTNHFPDSPAVHVSDLSAENVPNSIERIDNFEEIHHTKTRLGRTIKFLANWTC
ncbi:hypothetical protein HNY73_010554 [Argiope bruennichi]|uniref:DUF5641 domain-containing protein n=1 Tax=Argiope bruennichi TaxID=94029 RepID=A0A8T0F1G9_ARGBR|nr:hypothetical protein HNY73_010554 [Argiope bruennichi]